MRLIDADTLIKDLSYLYTKNHIPVDMRAKETLSKIMEQPPMMLTRLLSNWKKSEQRKHAIKKNAIQKRFAEFV